MHMAWTDRPDPNRGATRALCGDLCGLNCLAKPLIPTSIPLLFLGFPFPF